MRKSKFFKKLTSADLGSTLPVPRLQILNTFHERDGDGYNLTAEYSLVTSHLIDPDYKIVLGVTRIGYSSGDKGIDPLYEPFRDGAHIRHDMWVLGLRGFVVGCGDFKEIDLSKPDKLPGGLISKMRSKK